MLRVALVSVQKTAQQFLMHEGGCKEPRVGSRPCGFGNPTLENYLLDEPTLRMS